MSTLEPKERVKRRGSFIGKRRDQGNHVATTPHRPHPEKRAEVSLSSKGERGVEAARQASPLGGELEELVVVVELVDRT